MKKTIKIITPSSANILLQTITRVEKFHAITFMKKFLNLFSATFSFRFFSWLSEKVQKSENWKKNRPIATYKKSNFKIFNHSYLDL